MIQRILFVVAEFWIFCCVSYCLDETKITIQSDQPINVYRVEKVIDIPTSLGDNLREFQYQVPNNALLGGVSSLVVEERLGTSPLTFSLEPGNYNFRADVDGSILNFQIAALGKDQVWKITPYGQYGKSLCETGKWCFLLGGLGVFLFLGPCSVDTYDSKFGVGSTLEAASLISFFTGLLLFQAAPSVTRIN